MFFYLSCCPGKYVCKLNHYTLSRPASDKYRKSKLLVLFNVSDRCQNEFRGKSFRPGDVHDGLGGRGHGGLHGPAGELVPVLPHPGAKDPGFTLSGVSEDPVGVAELQGWFSNFRIQVRRATHR